MFKKIFYTIKRYRLNSCLIPTNINRGQKKKKKAPLLLNYWAEGAPKSSAFRPHITPPEVISNILFWLIQIDSPHINSREILHWYSYSPHGLNWGDKKTDWTWFWLLPKLHQSPVLFLGDWLVYPLIPSFSLGTKYKEERKGNDVKQIFLVLRI